MKSIAIAPAILCTAFFLSGCMTDQIRPVGQPVSLSCRLPSISALPETKQSQEKGGLEITIVPVNYKAQRKDKLTISPAQPDFKELLTGPPRNLRQSMTFVSEEQLPELKCDPSKLQFAVRINNKLPRVFRGQGSVVQINVGGKLMPITRADYAEFVDGIVPPRNETELKIYGPAIDSLPEKGTIGIFLYDVVTATDTAGNTTEKQNYEWYYSYETKTVQENGEVKIRRLWMDNGAFQRHQIQQLKSSN